MTWESLNILMRHNQLLSAVWTQMARWYEEVVQERYYCVSMETVYLSVGSARLSIIRVPASPDNGNFAVSVSKSLHPFMLSALSDREPSENVDCLSSILQWCNGLIMYSYATASFQVQFNKEKQSRTDERVDFALLVCLLKLILVIMKVIRLRNQPGICRNKGEYCADTE